MRFSYLFVVTFGRTGSTLLQGILNTMPRTLIRGENNNFLHGLFQSWKALSDPKVRHVYGGVRNPWFGYDGFSRRAFEEEIRAVLSRFLLGAENPLKYDCLGFKEIRYLDLQDRAAYLDFLLTVFPNSALVLHRRDPVAAVQSGWWPRADQAATLKKMTAFVDFAESFHRANPGRTILTSHESITDGPRSDVARLFQFCAAKLDMEKIEAVLSKEHSYGNRVPNPEIMSESVQHERSDD